MAHSFDGPNKRIYIDVNLPDVVVKDLYSEWKEWVRLDNNLQYLNAFRSFGGDPTVEGQVAPAYYFLENGWRIIVDGFNATFGYNLYTNEGENPIITLNGGTALLNNSDVGIVKTTLQEALDYSNEVVLDPVTGSLVQEYPTGTPAQPARDFDTAVYMAERYDIHNIRVRSGGGQVVLATDVPDYKITGHRETIIALTPGYNFSRLVILDATVQGDADGNLIHFENCEVEGVDNISGHLVMCSIENTITIAENSYLMLVDCYSHAFGNDYPIVRPSPDAAPGSMCELAFRRYSGGLHLTHFTNPACVATIEYVSGKCTVESSCTAGEISIRGVVDVTDNSNGATIDTSATVSQLVTIEGANITVDNTVIEGMISDVDTKIDTLQTSVDGIEVGLDEATLHTALDSYANKDDWKADTVTADLTPVLTAIANLNDIDLATIEASTSLAKQATLISLANAVALIPTTDSVTDITPVLTAIAGLNDVTAAEVRAAFNAADFKDKNTEAEIHAWLNSYTNKAAWKDKNTATDIHTALDSYVNKDDWKATVNATDLTPVLTAIANLNDIDAASIWTYTNRALTDKTGFGLSTATIDAITLSVQQAILDETDGATILEAIVAAIGNQNVDEISLVAAIRTDLERAAGKINSIQTLATTYLDAAISSRATPADVTTTVSGEFSEAALHSALDSYTNKDDWKASATSLQPVLDAISGLNDLDLATIEASTALAKEATLTSIANAIALIPTTDSTTDLTPVLTAISNLNDVTAAEVRAAFVTADFKDKNTELEIHTWLDSYANKSLWKDKNTADDIHTALDSYANKAAWKATVTPTDLTPVLTAIANLNDVDLATIEGSTVLAKQGTLSALAAAVALIPTTDSTTDITPILEAIDELNDVTPAEVRAAFDEAEFKDKNTEYELHLWLNSYVNKGLWGQKNTAADIHTALDSYANKDDWKAASVTVDLQPVLDAIANLNNISVADVEGSTIIAKASALQAVADAVALIPTTDATADLTPVLDAIADLNNITPADVRAAFNEADFKDKNTELEIHTWLDSYTNKDDWKSTIDLSGATVNVDIDPTSIADAVWDKPVAEMGDSTTIGGYVKSKLLSVGKFLGLK